MQERAAAERVPVIVGVGQVNDRPAEPARGLDPVALMAEALRRADTDAGGGVLADCDILAVVRQIAFPKLADVPGNIARTLGIAPRKMGETDKPHGDSPVRLLNEAANLIGAGEAVICAVVGGEALRTAAALASAASADGGARSSATALRNAPHRVREGYAQSHGLVLPADIYPLYENALRARYGQTLAEGQAESGALWAGMSAVASRNEAAWLRQERSAEDIVSPGPGNRPLAFPYTKLQVANAAVNQGAGFLVTSLAEARRRGIPDGRMVHIGYGAAAQEPDDILARASYDRSASLEVVLEQTLSLNRISPRDLAWVELYSCFPCIPKLARRVLDWPLDRPITVHGGLTFGGGPIGNYMSHAIAAMTNRLRGTNAAGLLFGNGGYATTNHAIVLSGTPTGAVFPQDFDMQHRADARRGAVPAIDPAYAGPARIETYTAFPDESGDYSHGVVVALTPQGKRTLAHSDTSATRRIIARARQKGGGINDTGLISRDRAGIAVWNPAPDA